MKATIRAPLALFLVSIFLSSGFAQVENLKGSSFDKDKKFFVDFLDYYSGNPDSTLVRVFVQVPYDQVQFFKSDKQFKAKFTATVSIFDEDEENLVSEAVWDENITADNFDQTISKLNYNISLKNFRLKPDKYSVRVSVEDKNSKNTYIENKKIEVRKFSEKLDVSDVMLIANETSVNGEKKIIPNVSRNVITKKAGIPFFYEINSGGKGKFKISYSINTKLGSSAFQDTVVVNLNRGKNPIYYNVRVSSLSLGTYTINISVENIETKDKASVSVPLISRWSGVPGKISDLDLAIDQLVYIASSDELDYIRNAPNRADKIKRFSEFWKTKDPDPNDEENQAFDEYYNRVAYANDHFSRTRDGWKTDMGMVYIVLGKPDDVERHPFESGSKPYEIWDYYNLNRRFVFLDETGVGDYRLMNPLDFDNVRDRVN